jgi:integrase
MPARAERENTFHPNIRRDYLETSFQRAREDGQITEGDEGVIRRYISEREATRGISEGRALKIGYALIQWRRFIPAEYIALIYGDVIKGLELLKKGKSIRGRAFKQNTLHDHIRILKTFLPWLVEEYRLSIPEKKIREIKVPAVDRETTHPEEILSEEEVLALLKVCLSDRDRALIGTLYESGCRVGELARLTWQDVAFDEHGVRLYITDRKTRKRRYSRLTMSAPYLKTLKDAYPKNRVGEVPGSAPVFISSGEPIEYHQVTALLRRLVKRAGIEKRIHLHLFRKSRITEMVREGYQESVIKESCWGNVGTSMFKTYVRLSEKAIDEEFLRRQGRLPEEEERQVVLTTRTCGNCHQENPPTALWCNRCRSPLTKEAAAEEQATLDEVRNSPIYQAIMSDLRKK